MAVETIDRNRGEKRFHDITSRLCGVGEMEGELNHRRELKERGKKEENREDIGLLW
jgi:hypothetical protein